MKSAVVAALYSALAFPTVAVAQQHGGAASSRPASTPPPEARQFDFLIGQWELVVTPKVSGLAARIHGAPRLLGMWKAWRAFDGFGIEDELRIMDRSGNPSSLSHVLRGYSAAEHRWITTSLDAYRGRISQSTAEWRNGEMIVSGRGTDAEGKPTLIRSRFMAITPASFRFQQDRSSDEGKSWEEGVLKIEAKRVAAAAPR